MKKFAKALMVSILGWQVRRLRKKHSFYVVAVAGSIGKTSTKLAIAQSLQQKFRVRYQQGNYNDPVSVPLIFFGLSMPSLFNPFAWLKIILKIESQIRQDYPWDVVVVEVGTDYPGNLRVFKKYLRADVGVLTAVSLEHMEFFDSLDQVAQEELTISEISTELVVNKELVASKYLGAIKVTTPYDDIKTAGLPEGPQRYSFRAAATVGRLLGMTAEEITKGLQSIQPVSGRGQRLAGVNNSTIIDDTYNASPEAVKAALDVLYQEKAPQRIAILGNMNELGSFSQAAHEGIGEHCDPKQLAMVLTLGPDANAYLAPKAEARGCKVVTFDSPYELAKYLKPLVEPSAVILAKGSQNKVFAEEAVKLLLADPADQSKLVRQSSDWLQRKQRQFNKDMT